jgi:hypothetical protein
LSQNVIAAAMIKMVWCQSLAKTTASNFHCVLLGAVAMSRPSLGYWLFRCKSANRQKPFERFTRCRASNQKARPLNPYNRL